MGLSWDKVYEGIEDLPSSTGYIIPGALLGSIAGILYGANNYKNSANVRDPYGSNIRAFIDEIFPWAPIGAMAGGLLGYGTGKLIDKYSCLNKNAALLLKKIKRGCSPAPFHISKYE